MSITIYKDVSANAIYFGDANGVQFLNSLQATSDGTVCSITDLAKEIDLVTNLASSEFVDGNGDLWGANGTEVCNALNAIFQDAGTPTTNLPIITSSLAVSIVEGETLNYELTADYGVGFEWDLSSVPGVTTVEGNNRKLVGGSSLSSGTYNIPVKAINYNGEDSETVVLTVSTPAFANTKSIQFNNSDYLGANASLLDTVLGRTSNGAGSGDAWSVSMYFKAGTSSNQKQTMLYFGSNDVDNGGHIQLKYNGNSTSGKKITLLYGTTNNNVELSTPVSSITAGTWQHVLVVYDGGTTGAASGSVNDYYSRFSIYIDGVSQTLSGSNANYGYTGSISGANFRVGRYNNSQSMRNNCKVDELAIWETDESANVSSIYNSGQPFDLSTLGSQPKHWWRTGDGDTYPILQDSGTGVNCTFVMYNMTSADIVSDVP